MQDRATTFDQLFPSIEPYETGMLALDGRHVMYWEQVGNPEGVPVVFLHGGPGAGATAAHRRFFDPDYYRIIIFDQRGAGRSAPRGEIADNTTIVKPRSIEKSPTTRPVTMSTPPRMATTTEIVRTRPRRDTACHPPPTTMSTPTSTISTRMPGR